jgi:NADH:ubiquinone oxidoreductase subunit 6 (subunit J)
MIGILEIVSAGIVISACLAIFFDEAVYSVAALAGTFMLTALLYAISGATYVAIFQFAVAVGTLAILFLSGEMLSEKSLTKNKPMSTIAVVVLGIVLTLPAIFITISSPSSVSSSVTFGEALWNYNAVDVVLQGLVILTLALGITIVLFERKKKPGEKRKGVK